MRCPSAKSRSLIACLALSGCLVSGAVAAGLEYREAMPGRFTRASDGHEVEARLSCVGRVADLDAFHQDPRHPMQMSATLEVEGQTRQLEGTLWFLEAVGHRHRRTSYRLTSVDGGAPLFLEGVKEIRDEAGADMARDLLDLPFGLWAGEGGVALGEGVVRVEAEKPWVAWRFMRDIRILDAAGWVERLREKRRYASLYLRAVREVYSGPALPPLR